LRGNHALVGSTYVEFLIGLEILFFCTGLALQISVLQTYRKNDNHVCTLVIGCVNFLHNLYTYYSLNCYPRRHLRRVHPAEESLTAVTIENTVENKTILRYIPAVNVHPEEICVVCLEQFYYLDDEMTDDKITQIDECQHTFHTTCIQQWIQAKKSVGCGCPVCRKPINV
jgi:hypothetical protein